MTHGSALHTIPHCGINICESVPAISWYWIKNKFCGIAQPCLETHIACRLEIHHKCFFPHSNGSWKHSCPDGFTANHCACLYPACSHIFCIFLMFITTFFWSFNTKHIVFVSLNFHSYPCCWVNKTTNDLQGFEWLRQRCAHRLILRLQTWTLGRWSTSGLQRNSDLWVWQCSISHPVFHQTLWTIIISYVNAPL